MEQNGQPSELGLVLGRGQAFGFVANHCLNAQAQCLRAIHDSESYKSLGLTWEQFCQQHVGLSRPRVDALLHNLDEFGEIYLRLSEIVKVSPETYRHLAPSIEGGQIEIDGELVDIVPENAVRIRQAVSRLRSQLAHATGRVKQLQIPNIIELRTRFDACYEGMNRLAGTVLDKLDRSGLQGMIGYAHDKLKVVARTLAENPPIVPPDNFDPGPRPHTNRTRL